MTKKVLNGNNVIFLKVSCQQRHGIVDPLKRNLRQEKIS